MSLNPSPAGPDRLEAGSLLESASNVLRSSRAYYARLLGLRLTAGRQLIDELCHGVHAVDWLYQECTRLDDMLEQFTWYQRDYDEHVVAAEVRRFHTPGHTRATDDEQIPCSLCRKAAVELDLATVIPARDAA